jgi:hypothetical protein
MKTLIKKPLFVTAAFCALLIATGIALVSQPQLTALNWHVDITTLATHVRFFSHIGAASPSPLLGFLFFMRPVMHSNWELLASFIGTLLFAGFVAAFITKQFNVSPIASFIGAFALLVAIGIGSFYQKNSVNATRNDLLKQIWINQIMEKFYDNSKHLLRSQDMTAWVNNNIINLADAGVDPDVLIDNNVYPIPVDERPDNPLAIPLSRFRTKNTVIRDAEAVQLAYNKMESVIRGHRNKMAESCLAKATYSWTPAQNGQYTPVFATTGAARGDGTNGLAIADIATAQEDLDELKAPTEGRILVLRPKHRSDLIKQDALLLKAFADLKKGEIMQLYGFEIYVSTLTASFNVNTGIKNAYGAAPAGTDRGSSLFYIESEVMRADGDVEMFARLRDPEADGDIIGFAKRFIGLPIRNKYQGAIYG